jgi:hypothetical protein
MLFIYDEYKGLEEVDVNTKPKTDVRNVYSVAAANEELNKIIKEFNGIPYHSFNLDQRWYGDAAKFIVANW